MSLRLLLANSSSNFRLTVKVKELDRVRVHSAVQVGFGSRKYGTHISDIIHHYILHVVVGVVPPTTHKYS